MPNNNWSVASKVRKNITFAKLPVIGDYVDVKFKMSDIIIFGFGGAWSWQLWQYFPSNQIFQAVFAVALTMVMTIYLMFRDKDNPEKSNFDILMINLNIKKRRNRHYVKLSPKHLEN